MSDDNEPKPILADPNHVPVTYTDWIVTGGIFENVVNFTFGVVDYSLRHHPTDPVHIYFVSKLRFSRDFATRLHGWLGEILNDSKPGTETPPVPPNTRFN